MCTQQFCPMTVTLMFVIPTNEYQGILGNFPQQKITEVVSYKNNCFYSFTVGLFFFILQGMVNLLNLSLGVSGGIGMLLSQFNFRWEF